MPEWVVAYFALFGLSAAAAAWTMRKREWSWLGLYVALGYLFGSMAKHLIWLSMLLDPAYRQFTPTEHTFFYWPPSLPWGLLVAAIGVVEFYAMIGALRRPQMLATIMLFPIALYQLTMTAWGVSAWIVAGTASTMSLGSVTFPAWLGVTLYLALFDVPFVFAIPWGLSRLFPSRDAISGRILERFAILVGTVLVALAILVSGIFVAAVRTSRLAGSDGSTSQAFVGISLLVLIGLVVFVVISFRRVFLGPAIAIIEGIRNDGPLTDPDAIGPIWRPLAQSLEDSRRRGEEYRDELEMSREALHRSDRLAALGQLLAGVSHELNNPLAAVIGQASMLAEDLEGTEHSERVFKIQRASDRCARIVQSFLAMARQRTPEYRMVSLNDLVRQAIELIEYQLRAGDVSVELSLDDSLPAIEADPDQLHQVIVNLLTNARQALEGVAVPKIAISTTATRGRVCLRVADNGPGIPPELRARIFDPFFTTKDIGAGTGIGLSYSLGIVEAHGGKLKLEAPRVGTAFSIVLPVSKQACELIEGEPERTATEGGRALVVDDESDVAETLADMLARLGLVAEVAIGGKAAERALAGNARFDLVICDFRMPEIDGPALHAWIAQNRPELLGRFVVATGDTMSERAASFVEQTGCPALEKPFDRTALRALIEGMPI